MSFAQTQAAAFDAAEARRAGEDRVENGLQFVRGRRDRAQHFGDRGALLDELRHCFLQFRQRRSVTNFGFRHLAVSSLTPTIAPG